MRLVYVGRVNQVLRGQVGTLLAQGRGPGPRNRLVRLDGGELVVAPWGCWRKAGNGATECQSSEALREMEGEW